MPLTNLLSLSTYKIDKSRRVGVLSGILHLLPHTLGGNRSVCPWSTAGCRSACLVHSGRGKIGRVQNGRQRKTDLFFQNRERFLAILEDDIAAVERKAMREGMIPAVRLNGTSDLPYERIAPDLFLRFPQVQFYDYTKSPERVLRSREISFPSNYHLTYSRSENPSTECHALGLLASGFNVAMVFEHLPDTWANYTVIDGDKHDCRFFDPPGTICGLTPKGKEGKLDQSGFVIR